MTVTASRLRFSLLVAMATCAAGAVIDGCGGGGAKGAGTGGGATVAGTGGSATVAGTGGSVTVAGTGGGSAADAGTDGATPACAPSQTTDCFANPSACCYPDATNTGVPPGTALTASGDVTASTPGMVVENLDVTGSIEVAANDVTIRSTRITVPAPGCGTATTCGNSGIKIDSGVTGTLIQDVEITTAPGATVQQAIGNLGGETTRAVRVYAHGPVGLWYGSGDIEDTYHVCSFAIADDHVENLYNGGGNGTLIVNHCTLLNPISQTSTVFDKNDFGDITTTTVTNSLLAGGGYTLSGGGGGSGGNVVGPVKIAGNRFARCLTSPVFDKASGGTACKGGPDAHGYFPNGGYFGTDAYFTDAVTTWSGNIWDDDLSPVTE